MDIPKPMVLVVDDDAFTLAILEDIISSNGYAVKSAQNGKEALKIYDCNPDIGLIISDMNMPEMNGIELIRNIREKNTDIPIIILTANDEISIALEAIKSGATDYLLKDENIQDTILHAAKKAIEKGELKKQNLVLIEHLARKNEELKKRNQQLLELNQLKNKFLGIAAHDLRNPLAAIQGLSELLIGEMTGRIQNSQMEWLDIIHKIAGEMFTLLENLLDVSIIESGNLEIRLKQGNIKLLIEERLRISRVVAEKKGISISANLYPLPDIPFDANRISQVIDNYLSNAIKFSPPDSNITVFMNLDDNMVKISVTDQGPGLNSADMSRVFGEFQRLSSKPTGGEKSTGLGLAIVKKIVEAHGGSVSVESQPGMGSTFSFKIPCR